VDTLLLEDDVAVEEGKERASVVAVTVLVVGEEEEEEEVMEADVDEVDKTELVDRGGNDELTEEACTAMGEAVAVERCVRLALAGDGDPFKYARMPSKSAVARRRRRRRRIHTHIHK
jgi:hypothetical protein